MKTFDRIPLLVTIKTDQTILNGSILPGFKIKRNFWVGAGIDRRIWWRNVRGIRDHDCLISFSVQALRRVRYRMIEISFGWLNVL